MSPKTYEFIHQCPLQWAVLPSPYPTGTHGPMTRLYTYPQRKQYPRIKLLAFSKASPLKFNIVVVIYEIHINLTMAWFFNQMLLPYCIRVKLYHKWHQDDSSNSYHEKIMSIHIIPKNHVDLELQMCNCNIRHPVIHELPVTVTGCHCICHIYHLSPCTIFFKN